MTHRIALCFAFASLLFATPKTAAAANLPVLFDTVVAVELNGDNFNRNVVITGIRTGSTTLTATIFSFEVDQSMATLCQSFALNMMFNPGVFRLAIGSHTADTDFGGGCKLILR